MVLAEQNVYDNTLRSYLLLVKTEDSFSVEKF